MVVIGSWLYTIGGVVGGGDLSNASSLVEAIDTTVISPTWVTKATMLKKRYSHACNVGVFDGQEGVFVAGGDNDATALDHLLTSTEFFNPAMDTWQEIGSLNTPRSFLSMTMLGGDLIVSGGAFIIPLPFVETWNGTNWVMLNENMWMEEGRYLHAAVSIKAGTLICT